MRHRHIQDVAINVMVNVVIFVGWLNLFLLKLVASLLQSVDCFDLLFLDCLGNRLLCFGLLCQAFKDLLNWIDVDRD